MKTEIVKTFRNKNGAEFIIWSGMNYDTRKFAFGVSQSKDFVPSLVYRSLIEAIKSFSNN